MKRPGADPRQKSLFEQAAERPAPGSLQFDAEWRAALNEAIVKSQKPREVIAAQMEQLLGGDPEYPISTALLNAWTAASKTTYRFPLIYLPAFIEATGARWLLDRLAYKCGCTVMDEAAREAVTLGVIERDIHQLKSLKRNIIKRSGAR